MAAIKAAPRSALTAFATDAPYLAAGTMAGTIDPSFDSTASVEIFALDFASDSPDLPLAASIPSDERFHRLCWSRPAHASDGFSLGLLAGGLGDGTIAVWNPKSLLSSDLEGAVVAKLERHTGPVRGLEFNPLKPNQLVSGADGGELCIWDFENPKEPSLFPPLRSVGSSAQTEISFVSWNPKFAHILASTSYNGMTVVWDLRQQKFITNFPDSHRRRCSVLQWNPDNSIQLITASDDDSSPSLRVWDIRKTTSPTREFVGHTKGVIAMSWCSYDSSLLLTCAKDNRTICWDPTNGEMVCEMPPDTNSNFDVHWYPKIPGVISASSFDVRIGLYNIEACSRLPSGEFGAPARKKAPKWLKCPTGASFGFGGKLISFRPTSSASGAAPSSSEVFVHDLVTEHDLVNRSTEFESSIQNGEKTSLRVLCDKKSEISISEYDRETWAFLKVMFEEEGTARTKLLAHLGFDVPSDASDDAHDELGNTLTNSLNFEDKTDRDASLDEASAFPVDNGEDFFNNPYPSKDEIIAEENNVAIGNEMQQDVEDHLTSDISVDDSVQRALVVGDYKGAVLQCISANRMADALVIAHAGSPSLWETTRNQYLKNSVSPYLKVVSALVSNDLVTLVNTRPLNCWKETLALLCTFAQKEEWTVLCDCLASRLLTVGNTLAATLCYICAGNIDKTVEIWSQSLKAKHEGRSYVDLLQDLMEKTIVLALATGQKRFSSTLSKLVENYAELLASQGLLTTAMEYLKLLGSEESSHELAILRDRIALSANIETGTSTSLSYQNGQPQPDAVYDDKSSFAGPDNSQYYYQPPQPQHPESISRSPYGDGYQHPAGSYGGYPQLQQKPPYPQYNPAPYQPPQTTQMFVPTHTPQIPQPSFTPPVPEQPTVRPFNPSTPPALRNVEQYQQPPTLGSQLYSGGSSHVYQPGPPGPALHGAGPPQVGAGPGQMFPHAPAPGITPGPRSFMPVTNPNLIQRPGMVPMQPPSPTQSMQVQAPAAPPAAPPPTVQTVNTSNVPVELRPVISTLTRLYQETSEALGGERANPAKKREIDDNSRKIGGLFAKLNNSDISPNAASKLRELCQALDAGDFASANHIQVLLTTSDWDECNQWLAPLKRMIKTRQSVRIAG